MLGVSALCMSSDIHARKPNEECEEEMVFPVMRGYVPPGNVRREVTSHKCNCGEVTQTITTGKELMRLGFRFPNKECESCGGDSLGSLIIRADSWSDFRPKYDRTGSLVVSELIVAGFGIRAGEDYTQAVCLEEIFQDNRFMEGGLLVQPHYLERSGRALTSSNILDIHSLLSGYSRSSQRVHLLRGRSADGKIVERLLVLGMMHHGIGYEGEQLVEEVMSPDGIESELWIMGDGYISTGDSDLPVEMFLASAPGVYTKLQRKLCQLAQAVRAGGEEAGYILFIDLKDWRDREDSTFGLVRIPAEGLLEWLGKEERKVSSIFQSVQGLMEPEGVLG